MSPSQPWTDSDQHIQPRARIVGYVQPSASATFCFNTTAPDSQCAPSAAATLPCNKLRQLPIPTWELPCRAKQCSLLAQWPAYAHLCLPVQPPSFLAQWPSCFHTQHVQSPGFQPRTEDGKGKRRARAVLPRSFLFLNRHGIYWAN